LKNTIYEKLYHNSDKVNEAEVDTSITSTIENYVNKYTEDVKSNTSEYISEQLAIIIVRIFTWIGLFIVSRVLLLVIRIFTDAIGEIPIIKQFNKSGGVIYGVLEGFLIINVIFAILYMINPICLEGKIEKNIDKSHLGKAVYKNNLIINTIIK